MCIVKKISVLCFVISFGITHPMKRSLEPDKKNQRIKNQRIVTFKSLKGFPLTSLSKGPQWFSSLSTIDKTTVTKTIVNHKDERLEALFNIALRLPDIQVAIAQHLYKDDDEHVKHVEAFLHMPIAQAYCYEGFLDIINDEKNAYFKSICSQSPYFKPDIICGFAKEITALCELYDIEHGHDKSELESIAKVVERFQDSFSENDNLTYQASICRYEFYESFTLSKFIKEDLRYLPLFLSVFITLALPWFNICGVDEKNVGFNTIANDFNAEAVRAHQATGSHDFLRARVQMRDEHRYCLSPFVYMKMVSWLSACIPVCDLRVLNDRGSTFDKAKIAPFAAGFIFYKFVEYIASLSAKQPIMGASCVTGLYLLACCVYHVAVKEKKYDYVAMKKLPALLQLRDIRIV